MLEILQGLQQCWENKERAALATIIEVDGGAYRREGARCLILESGTIVGILSGGCVEGDLLEQARQVMDTGIPRQTHYDFRQEGDLLWGLGVGCNGAITIWLQPFDPVDHPDQAQQQIQAFKERASALKPYITGLVLESKDPGLVPEGSHWVLDPKETELGAPLHSGPGMERDEVSGVYVKLFVETVKPRPRLMIFGAGADAVPLVQGAKSLQWHVTVTDHRKDFLERDHFIRADERILVPRSQYLETISISDVSYIVIMTHNYELDRMLVQTLLFGASPYVGVLGSRSRMERMLQDIRLDGVELNEEALEKLHSPVGLDIGAESPEEIALSILSELVCRKNARSGHSLRQREGPLHERQHTGRLMLANL